MKKITISALVFTGGVAVGVLFMVGGSFFGAPLEVSSNSDKVCKSQNLGTSTSGCTGGSWTTWDLDTHTQIYQGFVYTTHSVREWYKNNGAGDGHPNSDQYTCGSQGIKDVSTTTSTPCTMTRVDPGAPNVEVNTVNVPATCENCLK